VLKASEGDITLLPILDRIVRAAQPKPADPLTHVLALKWVVHSRAELDDVRALEDRIRLCGIPDLVLDSVEGGTRDMVFWLHCADPKRAFKALAKLPPIAERLSSLQAAFADRNKLQFTPLWPK
jgi:hypothetical protein